MSTCSRVPRPGPNPTSAHELEMMNAEPALYPCRTVRRGRGSIFLSCALGATSDRRSVDTIQRWTGHEARLLREALRMSVRAFAAYLGVTDRTISKWEAGGRQLVPGPESQALLDTALNRASAEEQDRFRQALGEQSAQVAPRGGRFTLIPSLESGLIHRSDEYDSLISVMAEAAEEQAQVVAICGPGGFGKTTLATQVCHDARIRDLFPEILWVETGHDCTSARLVELISDLCFHLDGTRPALADPEQAGFHLARIMSDRRLLLVIDNVWSAADLSPFLVGAPRCLRLVTTRNVRICPSATRVLRLGTMSAREISELLMRTIPALSAPSVMPLAELCGGWPLLASVVGANISHDVDAGATPDAAVAEAGTLLRAEGPSAFDVWDVDQRRNAIGHAISASLRSLDEHVALRGIRGLSDRYLSLAIFPAATPIPISVLARWWGTAHGWNPSAVRQFCRLLADRSLISAHLADRDAVVLHDVFRYLLRNLVDDQWTDLHRALLDTYRPATGSWLELGDESPYLWRHLAYHLHQAGLDDELVRTFASPDYMLRKIEQCGHGSLVADHRVLQAVTLSRPDDPDLATRLAVAMNMSSAGYLLQGLERRSDLAATLLVALEREQSAREFVDSLRQAVNEADGLGVLWTLRPDKGRYPDGHIGAVVTVAAQDGLLASGGEDGVLRLWDLDTRRLLHFSRGHTGWIYATAISTDGRIVASAGEDTIIRLWRTDSGVATGALMGHASRIRTIAFASGPLLVSGGEDGRVCVWDTERRMLVRQINTATPVWTVAVGCNDTAIAVAGEDEFVRLYDLRTGGLLDEQAQHRDWVRSVAFAAGSQVLVSGSGDRTVRVWDVSADRLVPVRRIDVPDRVRAVTVSDQGEFVIAAGEDAIVRAFTAEGLAGEAPMPPDVDWVRATAVTADGAVVAGCEDGGLRFWDSSRRGPLTTLADGSVTVWSAGLAEAGNSAVLGHGDGTITVHDATTKELRLTLSAGHGRVWSLATAAGCIAAACGDGAVRAWSLADEAWTLKLNADVRRSWAVALSPAGDRLAASDQDGQIRVWAVPSGELLWDHQAKAGRIRSLAFDGQGELLAAACGDGIVRFWRPTTGDSVTELASQAGWSRAIAVEPSGDRLAVGSGAGDIEIYEIATGDIVARLAGHAGRILMLGFAGDGDRLGSAAADGTARSWSIADQRELAQVRVDASGQCAAFDAISGRLLLAGAAGVTCLSLAAE